MLACVLWGANGVFNVGIRTASTLVLGIAEQLNHTALIGGKANNLTSDLTDERSAARRLALGAADLVLGGVEGGGFLYHQVSQTIPLVFSSRVVACGCSVVFGASIRDAVGIRNLQVQIIVQIFHHMVLNNSTPVFRPLPLTLCKYPDCFPPVCGVLASVEWTLKHD